MNKSVLKEWVTIHCTWKEQTVLLCAIRGPDAGGSPQLKAWTRWIRSVVLNNAAPHKTFMRAERVTPILKLAEESPLVFDMLPVHFLGHLMHALEVIGYRHHSQSIANDAREGYRQLCEYLHLTPETKQQMEDRLKDEV